MLGCTGDELASSIEVDLQLPEHFPVPWVPSENHLTAQSVELGRYLFYDTRLSGNGTVSCSSCHKQEFAFADDRPRSLGATEESGTLNAPALTNVIYLRPLTWAHDTITSIEDQLLGPMFGESPVEMGMTGATQRILDRLTSDTLYQQLFEEAFPAAPIRLKLVRYSLASFVRSLVSYRAPFDAFIAGDRDAISIQARRGSELFYSSKLGCGGCHAGFAFTTAAVSAATGDNQSSPFHNIGLYNIDGAGSYPDTARGLIEESGVARDMGRFRVPSLRNVALTAPYGHDGSVPTLEDFIAIYEAGGRHIESGPFAGDGRESRWRSTDLKDFSLADDERIDLIAFLESLSDVAITTDQNHSNPWRF
ncbi:MAG: di-heme enzyme [Kofleriaceae bacterium]|nr:di-heme enzyme [Kofleriaceae bacterium]